MNKLISSLAVLYSVFIFSACQKEAHGDSPDDSKEDKQYLSRTIMYNPNTWQTYVEEFKYDNQKRVIEYIAKSLDSNIAASVLNPSGLKCNFDYNGSDKLPYRHTEYDLITNEKLSLTYYKYNGQQKYLDSMVLGDGSKYKYGNVWFSYTNNEITTYQVLNDGSSESHESVDTLKLNNGNVILGIYAKNYFTVGYGSDWLGNAYQYDNKHNPYHALNIGNSYFLGGDHSHSPLDGICPNNAIEFRFVDAAGPSWGSTSTFTYDTAGYPVTCVESERGNLSNIHNKISYEYVK